MNADNKCSCLVGWEVLKTFFFLLINSGCCVIVDYAAFKMFI